MAVQAEEHLEGVHEENLDGGVHQRHGHQPPVTTQAHTRHALVNTEGPGTRVRGIFAYLFSNEMLIHESKKGFVSLLVKASIINVMELLLNTSYLPGVYNRNAINVEQSWEKSR